MSRSRGVLAGLAAASVGAVVFGSVLLSGSGVASAQSVCDPPSGAAAGTEYTCDVDGVRATVRVLDHNCIVLVRATVLNAVTKELIPGTAQSAGVDRALVRAHVSVGDCRRETSVVAVPVPVPVNPALTDNTLPTEAPVPNTVVAHLPVTN